jgi:IclR family pca regulon transcriptional regulator
MNAQNITVAKADFIEGMAKGLAVLESFDTERQRLNATLAAQRAGLTRAAARRHLLTLAHLGYLETDGGYFWLSPKVLRFSGSYLASARLPKAVQPALNRLAAYTGDSFSVAVLERDSVVIVARSVVAGESQAWADWPETSLSDRLKAPHDVRWTAHGLHLGARLPVHATSTGRMLLSNLPTRRLTEWLQGRELARLTPFTLTDQKGLRKVLNAVRKQDWCLASEEHELGVHALAVPLRNMSGQTVAALNVVMSSRRFHATVLEKELMPLLQATALELRPML